MQIGIELSSTAKTALMAFRSERIGETVPRGTAARAACELREAGVIGLDGGLTRSGSILRQRLTEKLMEEMF